jgi:hypothetical protein
MALARKRLAFSTLKLVLRSSLLIVAHVLHALRVGYAQVCSLARERLAFNAARSILHSLALASSHLLATALCTLIVHSSSLIVAHPIKHRAFIDAKAGELLALARPHAHARERLAFIVAHACKSSALIVPVIVAHSRKVRGLITLKLRNVLRLTMLIATVRIPTTYPHLRV